MAWRVGDVPVFRSAGGVTRIQFKGATVYGPAPEPEPKRENKGTHLDATEHSFGNVYVNELGRAAMASEKPLTFPTGSIIVREKLARKDDAQPQLLTVMIKRKPGFNPRGGNWEFLTADGATKKVRERQKTGSCLNCHSQAAKDFVLPPPSKKAQ